jgi:PAS domain S-box-containing protein
MQHPPPPQAPMSDTGPLRARWQSSHWVLLVGVVFAILALSAIVWAALSDRRANIQEETLHNELIARLLEDQVTRAIDSAGLALVALTETNALNESPVDANRARTVLSQILVGLPFVRATALIDAQGTIVASSRPGEVGVQIDLGLLGPLPENRRDALGPFIAVRGLDEMRKGMNASAVVPAGVGIIPLVRQFSNDAGRSMFLVALINPGTFANYQHLAIGEEGRRAVFASYAGAVLASSEDVGRLVGRNFSELPVFRVGMRERDFGSYVGAGVFGEEQIVAYRVSRTRPVVVLVEQAFGTALARWERGVRGFAIVGLVALVLIVALTLTVWRSLRAREAARRLQRIAQEKVARREQEFAVLMKSVQETIFRTDAKGAITFINERWRSLSGRDPTTAVGKRLQDMVLPEDRQSVQRLFSLDVSEGVRTTQARARAHGRRELLFDLAVMPLLENKVIVGFAGSAVDVTARAQAQRQLQTQLAFTAQLLELNPLPISTTDLQGRVQLVNRAWEEHERVRRADAVGRALREILPKDQADRHLVANRELLAQGGPIQYETRVRHRDGSFRDARVLKAIMPGNDGVASGILSVQMDISEFREAERATREARDSAEEASRAKSEFVANMSHELRTPLQSILGFAELGRMRSKEAPKLGAMFEDIHGAGQKMLALVNDLLDVAKIESTVGTFHLERIDLRGPVRAVARELEPLLSGKQMDLRLHLCEVPLLAKADPLRFQQAIRNIIANAIKFSPVGAVVEITGEATSGGEIHFCIRDQGPGIPEEELEHVFEAFVQSSKTKNGSGGTGLGLAICRKIVEAHGGSVYAENAAGGGAAFHVFMPMRGSGETMPGALQ